MDLDFFKKTRVLDGGMGQELLARGMEPNGTLWSANALLQEKYHKLLLDTHIDFLKSYEKLNIEIIDKDSFKSEEYFDIPSNIWSLKGLNKAIEEGKSLCLSLLS